MFNQKKKFCKSALMAAIAISVSAQGQSTVADDESLDEIIVTATKRETSLMETAVAVSAFG
jgi:outer membrane cobalamin receptor